MMNAVQYSCIHLCIPMIVIGVLLVLDVVVLLGCVFIVVSLYLL